MDCDAAKTHGPSFSDACDYMYGEIEKRLSAQDLSAWDERFQAQKTRPAEELLHEGGGWAALEERCAKGFSPPWLDFPERTLGEEQAPFIALLETGAMPPLDGTLPHSYLCGAPWLELFGAAAERDPSDAALLHYGIAAWESGLYGEGLGALERAARHTKAPIVNRTCALMLQKAGRFGEALLHHRAAIDAGGAAQSFAFAKDYLDALNLAGRFEEAFAFYESLGESLRAMEALRHCAAAAAFETGRYEFLKGQFQTEFAATREGETRFVELWYALRARERAAQTGEGFAAALETVRREEEPPYTIDFRTYTPEA